MANAPMSGNPDPEKPTGDEAPSSTTLTFYCDLCGTAMLDRHCKLTCPICGYQRDCSDP
jgi:rubrerythrin